MIPCDKVLDMGKIRCYRNAKSRHLTGVDRIKKASQRWLASREEEYVGQGKSVGVGNRTVVLSESRIQRGGEEVGQES